MSEKNVSDMILSFYLSSNLPLLIFFIWDFKPKMIDFGLSSKMMTSDMSICNINK